MLGDFIGIASVFVIAFLLILALLKSQDNVDHKLAMQEIEQDTQDFLFDSHDYRS